MAKKIHIYFRDEFESGEFGRLTSLVIRALHTEFPGFIIHTDAAKKFREPFIAYVYGMWGDDNGQIVADAASKTIERLLSSVSWRQAYQPAPPIYKSKTESAIEADQQTSEFEE